MMPRTILAALGAFAAGAVLTLAATDALARPARAAAPSSYSNGVYGFSITPPAYPRVEKDSGTQTAMFFAPGKNNFAGNLGIMVQTVKMTLEDYVKLSRDQFEKGGLKVGTEAKMKVSGRDAVLWEYEGASQGRKLKFMALAVVDADRVFLVTGTSTQDDYEALSKEFRASIDSFKIQE
jgi:hypothetical protein